MFLYYDLGADYEREADVMAIYESGEDYLEAVLMIEKEKGMVRSIDVANQLGFSKPSVSVAVRNLCADGHLTMDDDKHLRLTEKGRAIAEEIYDRHRTLEAILVSLGVPEEQAEELRQLLVMHEKATGSKKARVILAHFDAYLPKFKAVISDEYLCAMSSYRNQNDMRCCANCKHSYYRIGLIPYCKNPNQWIKETGV